MLHEVKPSIEAAMAHFGVKGMKWGVRNTRETGAERAFRNASQKPFRSAQIKGELKTRLGQSLNRKGMTKAQYDRLSTKESTVKTGVTVSRVTRSAGSDAQGGNLFISRTRADAQIYRGVMPSSKFLGSYRRPSEGYSEVTMKVITKLRSPSEKERVDAFVRLMDERSIKTKSGGSITGRQFLIESGYGRQAKKLESLELGMMFYQRFTKDNGLKGSPINSAYFKSLQAKGYNALIDDNDRNITSKEPWLVIDSKGSLQNLRVKPLSTNDILKAQRNLKFPAPSTIKHFGIMERRDSNDYSAVR